MSRPQRSAPLPPGGFSNHMYGESPAPPAKSDLFSSSYASASTPKVHQSAAADVSSDQGAADMSFDGSGMLPNGNPNAVQVGIMKGRLQGLQHELQTSKRDLKDLSERLTTTTTKLNEQKVQNSALTHKYSALLSKLSATEQDEKQLEEILLEERRNAAVLKESTAKLREQVSEQEDVINDLKQQLAAKPVVDPSIVAAIRDRNQYVPTREVIEKQTTLIREKDTLVEQMTSALDRLILSQEEDETTLFVCRSAVLSAATDLESRLAHTENVVEVLSNAIQQYAQEQEEETSRMMISLMNENKELWMHVTKMRFDLDRANSELAAKNKSHAESVPRDQHEYTLKQITLVEEKLKRAQQTIEKQTITEKDVEEKMRDLMQQLAQARQKIESLESDLSIAQQLGRDHDVEISALHGSLRQKTQEVAELEALQVHQTSQIRSLSEHLVVVQQTFDVEGRQQIKQVQSERDEALDTLNRLRSDFEDSLHRLSSLEKELDKRTTYFNSYKSSIEEQHASYVRSLQEELSQSRQIFERELEDLRREVADRGTEYHLATRELDEERAERQGLKAALRSSEDEAQTLRNEIAHLQTLLTKSEERVKKLSNELDSLKSDRTSVEAKQQGHQQELLRLQTNVAQLEDLLSEERQRHIALNSTLEADWKETDRSRQALQEELKRLRQRVSESDQLRSLKDRMEKDKEQLMSENLRLHQQYQDVQQQNVSLQQTITQMKNRAGGNQQLSNHLEELQRKLQELPSLRYAADEARREALRAKEEMEQLRQERDEMSARLEFFLDESRSAAKKDNDLDKVFRDATNQVRRLDQQLEEVTLRSATRRGLVATPVGNTGGSSPLQSRRSPVRPWRN